MDGSKTYSARYITSHPLIGQFIETESCPNAPKYKKYLIQYCNLNWEYHMKHLISIKRVK